MDLSQAISKWWLFIPSLLDIFTNNRIRAANAIVNSIYIVKGKKKIIGKTRITQSLHVWNWLALCGFCPLYVYDLHVCWYHRWLSSAVAIFVYNAIDVIIVGDQLRKLEVTWDLVAAPVNAQRRGFSTAKCENQCSLYAGHHKCSDI